MKTKKVEIIEFRMFGISLCLLLALFAYRFDVFRFIFLLIAIIILGLTIFTPRKLNVAITFFKKIADFNISIILMVFYFLIFSPYAFFYRAFFKKQNLEVSDHSSFWRKTKIIELSNKQY